MEGLEIVILVFCIVLALVAIIYTIYFNHIKFKKIKEQLDDDSFDKESYLESKKDNKKRRIISNVFTSLFFIFSIGFFTTSIVISSSHDIFEINNQYVVHVTSNSMSHNNVNNTYLIGHQGSSKIYIHDIIAFDKYDETTTLKPMMILLYKNKIDDKEVLITHRLLKVNEDGTLILRGDSNEFNDPGIIKKSDVIGVYSHRLDFFSFITYIAYSPSLIVVFLGVLICFITYDGYQLYIKKLIK